MSQIGEIDVFDISPVVLGPALIFAFALFAIVGTALTRRLALPYINDHDRRERRIERVQTLLVLYGLVACLTLLSSLQTYSDASLTVAREARQMERLYEAVSLYPEPPRSRLQGMLRSYAKYVVEEAWPQIERGNATIEAHRNLGEIQRELERFGASTEDQRAQHANTMLESERLSDATQARMEAPAAGLPEVLWIFIVFGAIVSVGATLFLVPEPGTDHGAFVLLLSMLFGLIIFMIVSLDRPFRGYWRVSPAPYQRVYEGLMNPTARARSQMIIETAQGR